MRLCELRRVGWGQRSCTGPSTTALQCCVCSSKPLLKLGTPFLHEQVLLTCMVKVNVCVHAAECKPQKAKQSEERTQGLHDTLVPSSLHTPDAHEQQPQIQMVVCTQLWG
jgi:hypothetical protein